MSTMEHLLMQIFDRKSSIESQLKRQVECYGESLSFNMLLEGKKPPQWLWSVELGGPNNHDNNELGKEQLVSGILLPLPSHATPSNNAHFTMPARVSQLNNYMETADRAEQITSAKDILSTHTQNKSGSSNGKIELKSTEYSIESDPNTKVGKNVQVLPLSNKENKTNPIRENSVEQSYSAIHTQSRLASVTADSVEQPSSTNDLLHQENVDRGRFARSRSAAQSNCLESLDKLSDSSNRVICTGSGECRVVETQTNTLTSNVRLSNTCTSGRSDIDIGFDRATNVHSSLKTLRNIAPLPDAIHVIEPKRLHFDGTAEYNFHENSHISAEENREPPHVAATDLKEVMQPVVQDFVCSSFEKVNASDNDTSECIVNADTTVAEYVAKQTGSKLVEVECSERHSYPKSGHQDLHQSINTKRFSESLVDKDDNVEAGNVQQEQMTVVHSRTSVKSNNSACDCSKLDSMAITSFPNLEKENMESLSNDVPCKEAISRNLSEPSELDITLSESSYLHIDICAQPNQKEICTIKFSPNLEYSGNEVVISSGGKKQSQIQAEVQTEEVIGADSALAFDKEIALVKADIGNISSLKNSSSNGSKKSFLCKLSNSISPSSADVIFGLSTASVVNGSTAGIQETNATKVENATRSSYILRSSSGSPMPNDSDYCSEALKHIGINRNLNLGNHVQSTPNKKRRLTSSVISSYHLRSLNSNNEAKASSKSNLGNLDSILFQGIETHPHKYGNSWPKRRKVPHRSNNMLATSPRLLKPRDCMTVGSDNTVRSQPFFSAKSNTGEHNMDLEGCSYLVGNNHSVGKADKSSENLQGCSYLVGNNHSVGKADKSSENCLEGEANFNETTVCAPLEHNSSEMCNTTENILDAKHFKQVHVHENDMRSQTSNVSNSSQYDVTMPEFEGFNIVSSSFVDDTTILSNSDLSVTESERVSLLEQLSNSAFASCPSTNHKMNYVPIACQSLPDMDHFLKHINSVINSDNYASVNGRSYSHSMPYPRSKIYQDTRKIPLTPPIMKFEQKTVLGQSGASSVKHGSKPEFECFRIDENSSISDVKDQIREFDCSEEHISHGYKMKLTHKDAFTADPGKGKIEDKIDPDSVQSATEAYLSHKTRYSSNSKSKMESGDVGIKYSVRKAGLSLCNRSSKSRISGKLSELSKSRGKVDKVYKPSKIVSRISSFSPLVHKPQLAAAPVKGRKDIKVKALEAAELSKRLEEKRQNERELRKAAAKLEREKLQQENSRLLELKQKEKEDEKKKNVAEVATKKRQREEEKGREQKRRCFGKTSRPKDEMEKMLQSKVAKKESMVEGIKWKLPKKSVMQHNRVNVLTVDNINQKSVDIGKVLSMPKGLQEVSQTMTSDNHESREQSYELSPYTNSDDEDEDEEEARRRHKYVPLWARRESLDRIILSKYQLDPAEIFSRKHSFIVNEVLQMPTVLQPEK